jgi:hypothetical protein
MKGKYFSLIGTALTLALTSKVAVAQANKVSIQQIKNSTGQLIISEGTGDSDKKPAAEKPLRADVLKILCQDFPLNSRCQGTADNSKGSTSESKKKPDNSGGTATPGTAPSDAGTPGSNTGAPPDSAPLNPPPNTGTPDNTNPSGAPGGTSGGSNQVTPPGGAGTTPSTPPSPDSNTNTTPGTGTGNQSNPPGDSSNPGSATPPTTTPPGQ